MDHAAGGSHANGDATDLAQIERAIGEVWADLLGRAQVGIHGNFFDLGGRLATAATAAKCLRALFGTDLSLREFCATPTVAQLARSVLATRRAGRRAVARDPRTAIPAAPDRERAPLSFAQKRFWLLSHLEPGSAAYHVPLAFQIAGPLNVPALARALAEVVRRHEALRTTFRMSNGVPEQTVGPATPAALPVTDRGGSGARPGPAEIAQWAQAEVAAPFDLEHGPVFRAAVLRAGDGEHVLVLTAHHIAYDRWSMAVVCREVGALYDAYASDRPSPLSECTVRYGDFAAWQRSEVQGAALERLLAYWRRQLSGLPTSSLPPDRPASGDPGPDAAHCPFRLEPDLVIRLRAIGREAGATLHMTLLAAFQVTLARHSGREDLAVGVPVAGRGHRDLEGLVGCFMNTLVLRADLSADPTFLQVLERVRAAALDAYDHDDLPFELLVEALQPERQVGRNPLFQVLFHYHQAAEPVVKLQGLEVSPLAVHGRHARFDVEMDLRKDAGGLAGLCLYRAALFDAATIERLVHHFCTFLKSVADDPRRVIWRVPLLTSAEEYQLLVEWNRTEADFPRDRCLHRLFEEQATRTPSARAVVSESEELTYEQLNERADRLAGRLRSLGVRPDRLVGLWGERSINTLVGILGILKAGGAYVPLSAEAPAERIAAIVRDAKLDLVVASRNGPRGPESCRLVPVDPREEGRGAIGESGRAGEVRPEHLAYVLYTSGSTGTPRGVAVEHRSVVNLLTHRVGRQFPPRYFRLSALTSPITFDPSVAQMFSPLITGGTLVLCSGLEELLVSKWYDRLTAFTGAASVVTELAARHRLPATACLVAVGAEPVPPRLVELVAAHPTVECLEVLYGLTECAGYSTAATLFQRSGPESEPLRRCPSGQSGHPIGRPISNTQVFVLDRHAQPVPVGVPGELYIGGAGLARGYLNNPEETAKRFVATPSAPASRLYRTGDQVRWHASGQLEFLGRVDRQVKVRGQRVEPGEIEAALGTHPQVAECSVVPHEDRAGGPLLVAYCVPLPGATLTSADLAAHLRGRLPEYMVPGAFVSLPGLPRTPNGKVDRQALPAPDAGGPAVYVAPRTETEAALAGLWTEVLGVQRVGVRSSFFDLGGHSLLVIHLLARIAARFGFMPPAAIVFQRPTVEQLAAYLEERLAAKATTPGSRNHQPLLFCLNYGPTLAGYLEPEQAVFALPLHAENLPAYSRIEDLAAVLAEKLRSAQPEGPYYLAGYCYEGVVGIELARQLEESGHRVAFLGLIDCNPFGIPRGATRSAAPSVLDRLRTHRSTLAGLRLRHWPGYVFGRARTVLRLFRWRLFPETRPVQPLHWGERLFRSIRAYRPSRVPGRVDVFYSADIPAERLRFIRARWERLGVRDLRWSSVPGNHVSIWEEPNVVTLARCLRESLNDARQLGPRPAAPGTPSAAPPPQSRT